MSIALAPLSLASGIVPHMASLLGAIAGLSYYKGCSKGSSHWPKTQANKRSNFQNHYIISGPKVEKLSLLPISLEGIRDYGVLRFNGRVLCGFY